MWPYPRAVCIDMFASASRSNIAKLPGGNANFFGDGIHSLVRRSVHFEQMMVSRVEHRSHHFEDRQRLV